MSAYTTITHHQAKNIFTRQSNEILALEETSRVNFLNASVVNNELEAHQYFHEGYQLEKKAASRKLTLPTMKHYATKNCLSLLPTKHYARKISFMPENG